MARVVQTTSRPVAKTRSAHDPTRRMAQRGAWPDAVHGPTGERPSAMSLILPFIMCGGSGTRMWPVSRESLPKQFIPLLDERSTFQTTLAMLARPKIFAAPTVITNRNYRFLVGPDAGGRRGDCPW